MSQENIHVHKHSVTQEDRETLSGNKGAMLFCTGLSGSGKSTIANALEVKLHERGIRTYLLDGDNIRSGLNNNLSFSPEDRKENIRRIAEVGKLFVDSGAVVISAFIAPYIEDRASAANVVGDAFNEIYIKADLETCESRDPKGLYKKARAGEIPNFTGIGSPYEEPTNPKVMVDTSVASVDECVDAIIEYLIDNEIIPTQFEATVKPHVVDNLDKRRTIGWDFDGVINPYTQGFTGLHDVPDAPTPESIEFIKDMHEKGYINKILSSRPAEVILNWLKKYDLDQYFSDISNFKFPATVYIDDRALHFTGWDSLREKLDAHPKLGKESVANA